MLVVLGTFTSLKIFCKLRKFNAVQLAGLNPVTTENLGSYKPFERACLDIASKEEVID